MLQIAGILLGLVMVLTALEVFRQSDWGIISILGLLVLSITILIIAYWSRDKTKFDYQGTVGRHF